ncbi:MAG: aminoacyl-tRNA hydrolase, partial [Proteobacteria bacterium]|nr:aminoacyl-tRNA hydrolase [Pseudomonadota bacterium]
HNGLRSIDAHIGKDYLRVRIGIGHPGDKARVRRHVLSGFAKAEQPLVSKIVDAIAEAAPLLADGDGSRFMNRVSLAINPPRPKSKPKPRPAAAGGADDEPGED